MTAGPAPPAAPSCPYCGRLANPGDNFCEACRAPLTEAVASAAVTSAAFTSADVTGAGQAGAVAACPFCPSSAVSADGYCESCGRRAPSGRDHAEVDLRLVAGVTDRGLRHHRNEDAMALATAQAAGGPAVVAVVCDGVSSSARPDEASLAAAEAAAAVLLAAVRAGDDLAEASGRAVRSAQAAVGHLSPPPPGPLLPGWPSPGSPPPGPPPDDDPDGDAPDGAPAATFVSAVLTADAATLCWLGDSRAYWLGAGAGAVAQRLTTDDSLAEEMVAAGLLSAAEAAASPQAHVVTRWVGADLDSAVPHLARFEPPGPGVLLLCSDGLWNYEPAAENLARLALPGALTDPRGAAARLVSFALESGGRDNVTVVLAPYPLTPGAADPGAPLPAPPDPAPCDPASPDPTRRPQR